MIYLLLFQEKRQFLLIRLFSQHSLWYKRHTRRVCLMKLRKIVPFVIFLFIANLYFLASNTFLIIQMLRTPAGTVFPLLHNDSIFDYNLYLSIITMGRHGFWLFRDPYTSEVIRGSIFYIFYIIVGKLLPLSPPVAYHVVRIFSVELFFISIYMLCRIILSKPASFWASYFSIMATIAPITFYHVQGALVTTNPWWSSLDAVRRLNASPPHYYFGFALMLLSIRSLLSFGHTHKDRDLLFSIILIFVGGIVLPPILLPLIFGIPFAYLILQVGYLVRKKRIHRDTHLEHALLACALTVLLCLIINFMQTKEDLLSNLFLTWSVAKWNANEPLFNQSLILSFGLAPILSIPAVVYILKKKGWEYLFLSAWAFFPFIFLPFANLLGIGKIRLISAAPFVPFGILTAFFLFEIIKNNTVRLLVGSVYVVSVLYVSVSIWMLDMKQANQFPFFTNAFIPKESWRAIEFMKRTVPKDSIILSDEYMGNILPAYIPSRSYIGHASITLSYPEKKKRVVDFYTSSTDEEAADFLKNNRISFVYFGPDEKRLGSNITPAHPFLKEIYKTGNVSLYKVDLK